MGRQPLLVEAVRRSESVNRCDQAAEPGAPEHRILRHDRPGPNAPPSCCRPRGSDRQDRLGRLGPVHRASRHDGQVVVVPQDSRAHAPNLLSLPKLRRNYQVIPESRVRTPSTVNQRLDEPMSDAHGASTFQVSGEAYDRFVGRYSTPLARAFADVAGRGAGSGRAGHRLRPGRADRRARRAASGPTRSPRSIRRSRSSPSAGAATRASTCGSARPRRCRSPTAPSTPALAQLVLHFVADPAAAAAETAARPPPGRHRRRLRVGLPRRHAPDPPLLGCGADASTRRHRTRPPRCTSAATARSASSSAAAGFARGRDRRHRRRGRLRRLRRPVGGLHRRPGTGRRLLQVAPP